MRKINKIIVHCSDSDIKEHDDIAVIRKWHVQRGFDREGYHFYIKKSGVLQIGRPASWIGAHTRGENDDSISVCLGGRFAFTRIQEKALINVLKVLISAFDLTANDVYGHYEFNENKTCPNMDMNKIRRKLQ